MGRTFDGTLFLNTLVIIFYGNVTQVKNISLTAKKLLLYYKFHMKTGNGSINVSFLHHMLRF